MLSYTKSTSRRMVRSHKKSRHGCQRCKERKVKCDEEHPICRTCLRHFGSIEACVYVSNVSRSNQSALNAIPSSHVLIPRPRYSLGFTPKNDMQFVEMELFHHYTTCTATIMPRFEQADMGILWMMTAPQLSFTSDVVLSSLLGLAATHLFCCNPKNPVMKRSAQYYLAKTVKLLSILMSSISVQTAEPVMLVAMVLATQMRVRAAFILDSEPYHLPFEVFRMHDGLHALSALSTPFIQKSNVLLALRVEPSGSEMKPLHKKALLDRVGQDSLSLLEGTDAKGFDLQGKQTYEGALTYLNTIYLALLRREDPQWIRCRLCLMPSKVPMGFVGLLKQHDPRAMAILARFLALLKPCDDGFLYYDGCAEYEVDGIASMMPPDWLWAMEWPRKILTSDTLFRP